MIQHPYERLMTRLDTLEATIHKARRRAFWFGWACGVIGANIAWLWF